MHLGPLNRALLDRLDVIRQLENREEVRFTGNLADVLNILRQCGFNLDDLIWGQNGNAASHNSQIRIITWASFDYLFR